MKNVDHMLDKAMDKPVLSVNDCKQQRWIQCTQCGYGRFFDADDELDFVENSCCPECCVGLLKSSFV